MKTTHGIIMAVLVTLVVAGGARAQSWSYGGAAGMQTRIAQWADPQAYYVEVLYQGTAAPEIQTRIMGRTLDISVRQAAYGPGSFVSGGSSRTIYLPPDADPSRLWRREEAGRVLLVVPRQAMHWPRW